MANVRIHGQEFVPFIGADRIEKEVTRLAEEITRDLSDKDSVFIPVMNGSLLFGADLLRRLPFAVRVACMKLASYKGTQSTGTVEKQYGVTEDEVRGRVCVIVEDIVDTGLTIDHIARELKELGCAEVRVCTLLFKPEKYKGNLDVQYVGMRIPPAFVVGYGLDYMGLGRNLDGIFQLKPIL